MKHSFFPLKTPLLLELICLIAATSILQGGENWEPVASVEGITEYRLENGLRVLFFPEPSQPQVTVNMTYFVGSRHEGRGEKGMAHLLEHMLFKGTSKFGNLIKLLSSRGAQFNGTTWFDRTNYYETLPSSQEDALAFALELESERMLHSLILAEDLATEFTVVRNEFERGENNPIQILYQRMMSVAYDWHAYGFSTIGSRSDIERVPVENLRAFYKNYYQPDNAMLVIAGDFAPPKAKALVEQFFSPIPRPERKLNDTYTIEPTQDGTREVSLHRSGDVPAAGLLYHVCAGSHPDSVALEVMAAMLTEPPSGRLYRSLVEPGLASQVSALFFPTREPGAFLLMAEAPKESKASDLLTSLELELQRFAQGTVEEEEVNRAKSRLLKQWELAFKDSHRIGINLTESAAIGDWRLFFLGRDWLEQVDANDIQRVATHYLKSSNATRGLFNPTSQVDRTQIPETPDIASLVEGYQGREAIAQGESFEATPENIESRVQRMKLDQGMDLAILPKQTRGASVSGRLDFYWGSEQALSDPMTRLAADLLPELIMRGSSTLNYQQVQDRLDALKSVVTMRAGEWGASLSVQFQTDREHLLPLLALLADLLQHPSLPEEEFQVIRQQRKTDLQSRLSDPQALLYLKLRQRLNPYPQDSIHHVASMEEVIQRLDSVALSQLKTFHQHHYGSDRACFSLVGDMDAVATSAALKAQFGDWKSGAGHEPIRKQHIPIEASKELLLTPDKKMATIAAGTTAALNDTDAHYPALLLANYILGGFAESRLFTRLRQEEGLSYGAYSGFSARPEDRVSSQFAMAICAPENAVRAQAILNEELKRWMQEPVAAEELELAKQSWATAQRNRLADDAAIAGDLAEGLYLGRTMLFDKHIQDRVSTLDGASLLKALESCFSGQAWVQIAAGDITE